jgi:hypothetical protein
MLLRIRWFIMGVLTSLGAIGYLVNQLRKARERITARNLARTGMRGVADWLDSAADTVGKDTSQR